MKKFFILLAIILFANPAFSQNSRFESESSNSRFKSESSNSRFKSESSNSGFEGFSLELIIPDESSSSETLTGSLSQESREQICENISGYFRSTDKQIKCLKIITGKYLSDKGTEICKNMTFFDNQIKCLEVIAGKRLSDKGTEICKNINGSGIADKQIKCLEVIAGKHLSDKGAEICGNMTFFDKQIECLEAIAGKHLSDKGAEICGNKYYNRTQIECLEDIATEPLITNNEETFEQSFIRSTEEGRNATVQFCRTDMPNRYKDSCLEIATQARYIDVKALAICANLSNHYKEDCLKTIANKDYLPGIIEECNSLSSHNQVECLDNYGTPIDNFFQTNSQEEDLQTVIIQVLPESNYSSQCAYENIHGIYPVGGGCDIHGCWVAGGGCDIHGCWGPGGHCSIWGCVNEAPQYNICQ